MSTISLPYEKQIRHFFLGTAVASETDIAAFNSGASNGEIQIFGADGLNATTTGDFYIAKKNNKGGLSISDKITGADITYLAGTSPQTKVSKAQTITLNANPVVGEEYTASLKVHYGNSEENFIVFTVAAKATTTVIDDLLSALAKSLGDSLGASINMVKTGGGTQVVNGTRATGTVQLSAGASGSVDTLTVGGVEILGAVVAFDTDLDTTAAAVADQINAFNSSPNYNATVSTDTVTIIPVDVGVATGTVTSTTTTLTSVDVDLGTASAGVDGDSVKDNKYFSIDADGDGLVVTEKDWILDDFRVGLRTMDQLMWNFEVTSSNDTAAAKVVKAESTPVYAKGQGYQIIELERFLVGHRAEFELKDHTLGFGRDYDTVIGSQYYTLDLKYFDISRDDVKRSEKMLTLVSTSNTAINTIGNAIETRSSFTWTDL